MRGRPLFAMFHDVALFFWGNKKGEFHEER
jgi:hypothetical protein